MCSFTSGVIPLMNTCLARTSLVRGSFSSALARSLWTSTQKVQNSQKAEAIFRRRKCYYCGKPGHLIRNCRIRRRAEVQKPRRIPEPRPQTEKIPVSLQPQNPGQVSVLKEREQKAQRSYPPNYTDLQKTGHINVLVEGWKVPALLDYGADVNLISQTFGKNSATTILNCEEFCRALDKEAS